MDIDMITIRKNAVDRRLITWENGSYPNGYDHASLHEGMPIKSLSQASLSTSCPIEVVDRTTKDRQPSLLICHTMPIANGNDEQQRAWRWLEALSATHNVWLAVFAQDPVHLDHWRAAESRVMRWMLRPAIDRRATRSLTAWFGPREADLLLQTSPSIKHITRSISTRYSVCDLMPKGHHRSGWRSELFNKQNHEILTPTVVVRSRDDRGQCIRTDGLVTVHLHDEALWLRQITDTSTRQGDDDAPSSDKTAA